MQTVAANVLMNGKAPDEVRQGTFVDTDGTRTMVIWIEVVTSSPTEVYHHPVE